MPFVNLVGHKFNRLTVISRCGTNSSGAALWDCECDCGNHVVVRSADLTRGHSKSCGCYNLEALSKRGKHWKSKSRLYNIWTSLKGRCYNPNDRAYDDYGKRGITVCDEWKNSYILFEKWAMNNGYNQGLSIDRIDVNGNYEPSNCRWTNDIIQARNRRNSVFVSYHGKEATLEEMCQILDVNVNTIRSRMNKYGHTFESAVDSFPLTGKYVQYKKPKTIDSRN